MGITRRPAGPLLDDVPMFRNEESEWDEFMCAGNPASWLQESACCTYRLSHGQKQAEREEVLREKAREHWITSTSQSSSRGDWDHYAPSLGHKIIPAELKVFTPDPSSLGVERRARKAAGGGGYCISACRERVKAFYIYNGYTVKYTSQSNCKLPPSCSSANGFCAVSK